MALRVVKAMTAACLVGTGAATRAATNSTAAEEIETKKAVDAALSAVQGAMLLSAALPHHDGPKPSKATEEQMNRAGSLVYNSYQLLATAQQHVDAAREQLSTGDHVGDVGGDIATGESLVQLAKSKLNSGDSMASKARGDFLNNADPLGPQPEVPREWDNVDKMLRRTRTKLVMLQEKVRDAKKLARKAGQKVTSLTQKQVADQLHDSYGEQQDKKLLDFLSKY